MARRTVNHQIVCTKSGEMVLRMDTTARQATVQLDARGYRQLTVLHKAVLTFEKQAIERRLYGTAQRSWIAGRMSRRFHTAFNNADVGFYIADASRILAIRNYNGLDS